MFQISNEDIEYDLKLCVCRRIWSYIDYQVKVLNKYCYYYEFARVLYRIKWRDLSRVTIEIEKSEIRLVFMFNSLPPCMRTIPLHIKADYHEFLTTKTKIALNLI